MLKLWIVHRSPQQRHALARLCGLPESEFLAGAPSDVDFSAAGTPAAIVLGLDGDFEVELEFAHRHRARLAGSRWMLACAPEDADEAGRLFDVIEPEVLSERATARALRAFVTKAVVHRDAASLSERRKRERIAERFSAWLGCVEVPGLLRALDPSLSQLPLLVRGRPGSGRTLLCHYVELHRGAHGGVLRLHARDLGDPEALGRQLIRARSEERPPIQTIWIDEVDRLPVSTQDTLAEWIVHGSSLANVGAGELRWIATAGPDGLDERLEASLEQAFAPLQVDVPALADHPENLAEFAEEVASDWTRSVGGIPRHFGDSALLMLEAHPWAGDRAELEAVLRTTLAATSREVIEDVDLRFPSDARTGGSDSVGDGVHERETIDALMQLPEAHESPEVEAEPEALTTLEDSFEEGLLAEIPTTGLGLDPVPGGNGSEHGDESSRLADESFGLADHSSGPVAPDPTEAPPATTGVAEPRDGWRRLARSLSHEIRNPLVSIRTFAELLPEHFEDETFRSRFTELVGKDVAHISDVLTRLSKVAEREKPEVATVDVSALIESLLEERRERITQERLLVLRELERDAPTAQADARGLEVALAGLLDRALESLPERGDLFVATRHLERGADGQPRLRILLRHHNPTGATDGETVLAELEPTANLLEYVLAEAVIEASGGSMTIDATDAGETLILVDLRTPS